MSCNNDDGGRTYQNKHWVADTLRGCSYLYDTAHAHHVLLLTTTHMTEELLVKAVLAFVDYNWQHFL